VSELLAHKLVYFVFVVLISYFRYFRVSFFVVLSSVHVLSFVFSVIMISHFQSFRSEEATCFCE
jgi:hypothetical protein